ncbi:MAG: nickel pincer cofactor biosynthesis protein LarC [Gammaproteobacteria bacterium]|nr:nickel pincer cofactor biosynthesis protein LarC [Gammaproteobacteria bacterium]
MASQTALLYDCFSGISGDMHIGAMVDLGVPAEHLTSQLDKLALADEFHLQLEPGAKMGITGTRATVVLHNKKQPHARHLADIRDIIGSASYPERISATAMGVFDRIAVAEAHIHGTSVDAVHFHEVGAIDSIVDIVAAAICLDHLNVDAILCGPVEVGGGMVKCAHGLMPVPAPATAEILQGVPCHFGRVDQEATTPTGAAILKQVVHRFEVPGDFRIQRVGYGVGQKDFSIPNVLRVMLGEEQVAPSVGHYEVEENIQIECNIDDMSAEGFAPLLDGLLGAGAKDAFLTPVVMKKSRPGTKVSVLCAAADLDFVLDKLFAGSTTIGARIHTVEKRMLPRQARRLATSLGEVRVKIVTHSDGRTRWKPEHDDLLALARAHQMEYLEVKDAVESELRNALGSESGD